MHRLPAAGCALLCFAACAGPSRGTRLIDGPDAGGAKARAAATTAVAAPRARDGARAEIGEPAPDFALSDLDGTRHQLSAYLGRIVVLEWFNPACPYSEHAHRAGALREQPDRLRAQGIVWLMVNSEAPGQPGADPGRNRAFVAELGLKAPLLFDPSGLVGRAYRATHTPHCFVINEQGRLIYAGALDNAPLGSAESNAPRKNYVDAAIGDVRAGYSVMAPLTRAYGTPIRFARS